jgi:hypothetical protein
VVSGLIVRIVDIGHPEAFAIAFSPFEVIHEGPAEVALEVDSIKLDCI